MRARRIRQSRGIACPSHARCKMDQRKAQQCRCTTSLKMPGPTKSASVTIQQSALRRPVGWTGRRFRRDAAAHGVPVMQGLWLSCVIRI